MFTKDQITSVKKLEFNSNHYGYTVIADSKVFNIPISEGNTEYQIIKEWIEDGNKVEAKTLTWDDIRIKRDQILRDTDWTMTSGATVDQAQWAAYRQVIRDIPQTYKDKTPDDVVWPTQPSTAGPNT